MKELEPTKLEFLMIVNDNIIVQRYFNVRDYNEKSKNSMELYGYISYFAEQIKDQLKMKTVNYMMDNMYEIVANPSVLHTSITDGPEYFNIYIKDGDKIIHHRQFDAKLFPPKIRYTVDVRPYLKNLLMNLIDILSSKNLTYDYLEMSLA